MCRFMNRSGAILTPVFFFGAAFFVGRPWRSCLGTALRLLRPPMPARAFSSSTAPAIVTRLDLRALRHRGVGGAVGDVRAVAAVEDLAPARRSRDACRAPSVPSAPGGRGASTSSAARAAPSRARARSYTRRRCLRASGIPSRASRTDRSGRGWRGSARRLRRCRARAAATAASARSSSVMVSSVWSRPSDARRGLIVAIFRRLAKLHVGAEAAVHHVDVLAGRRDRRRATSGPCALALSSAIALSSVRSAGARSSGSDARGPPSF